MPLAFLLVTASAHAATYWVSPTGAAGNSGADSLSNAKTLAWFNANAAAGDICRFKSGTYADPIQPARDGTAGSRIRYYGFPQDPGAVTVANVSFGYQHGNYCTARWFRTSSGLTGCYGASTVFTRGDSIASVWTTTCDGGMFIMGQACVFDSLRVSGTITYTGQTHWICMFIGGTPGPWFSTSNVISNCTFSPTVNTTSGQGDVHIVGMSHTAYNKFINNTFNITVQNVAGYFFPVEMYASYYNQFQQNTWNIAMNGPALGSRGVWCHRDSSSYNRYFDNSVNVTGSGGSLSFMLSNGGSVPGSTGHNFYGNNVIHDGPAQPGTGVFWFYDGTRQDTLQFNTVSTNAGVPCVSIASGLAVNGTVFRHNTWYTSGRTAIDCANTTPSNSPRFVSDIFYCLTANTSGGENVRVASGFGMDSSGVYFTPGGTASRGLYVAGADGTPGSGGSFGIAGKALWGSPRFTDSSYVSFNPRLGATGYAVGANLSDGFAGAVPFAGGSSDVTPPATVSNLAVVPTGPSSLSVSWTAPGDDGTIGTASVYDLRWSASAITAANFASAIPVGVQPVPLLAGTLQSWIGTGLSPGSTYFYAIRTRDAAGNWSGVSNSASATTSAADTTPPAAIQDLTPGL
jgi:hypothetical protein